MPHSHERRRRQYKEAMVLKILDLDACPAMPMENGRGEKIKLVDTGLVPGVLALPIIAGAGGVKGLDLMQQGFHGYGAQFLAGFIAAAVSGFLVIWFLLRYLRTHDFLIFMIYRLAVAALVLLLIATGVRSATI